MEEHDVLIAAAQTGDLVAYDQLVQQYQKMVHGYAYSLLGDFYLAQDVAREAFVAAWRELPRLGQRAAFPGWLRRIVQHRCRRLVHDWQAPDAPTDAADHVATRHSQSELEAELNEMRETVIAAIRTLPPQERRMAARSYIDGYSPRDIASLPEEPTTAARRRPRVTTQRPEGGAARGREQAPRRSALSEDFRTVVGEPCRTRTASPSLAWFRDRWVLVWQDGRGGERSEEPYWFMLTESSDGRTWSEPRRIDMPDQVHCLPKLCVLGDRLFMLTHCYHRGVRVARSRDLRVWDPGAVMRMGDAGRGSLFAGEGHLFLAHPHWSQLREHGDSVELMRSSDGRSWTWLAPPCPPRGHGTLDATGVMCNGRICVVWRDHEYADEAARQVHVAWSDDDGITWARPVPIESLSAGSGSSTLSASVAMDGSIAVAQAVSKQDDRGWTQESRVQVAISFDGGRTWPEMLQYATGSFIDPAIAFALDDSLVIAASTGVEGGTQPWVVHSRVPAR